LKFRNATTRGYKEDVFGGISRGRYVSRKNEWNLLKVKGAFHRRIMPMASQIERSLPVPKIGGLPKSTRHRALTWNDRILSINVTTVMGQKRL
jgi:hypothetical protein